MSFETRALLHMPFEARSSHRQYVCQVKNGREPKQHHVIAKHMFTVLLHFKQFGSSHISFYFNTTAKRNVFLLTPIGVIGVTYMTVLYRCASQVVRQLVHLEN